MVAFCDIRPRTATDRRVTAASDLPPLLSRYLGPFGVAEQLLAEDVDNELLMPLAEADDGRQMLIVRRYGDHVVAAAELLSRQAAALIAAGRTDVHQSLQLALDRIASRLRADDDPEQVKLGVAVAAAVQAVVRGAVPASDGKDRGWVTMDHRRIG